MKKLSYQILFFSFILFAGCSHQGLTDADFVVPESHPAKAITIGWYAAPEVLSQLVGDGKKAKIVKDDSLSMIMLYIVKSEEHFLDSIQAGPMEAAHLVIPVEKPVGMQLPDQSKIQSTMVCPINIVDQSLALGNRYNEMGFPTYSGEIDLNVKDIGNGYFVQAEVKTANGLIQISANFNKEDEQVNTVSAMINPKPGPLSLFYGEETFTKIRDGKGNLKTGGDNLIKALNLSGQPYFLRLDTDISWAFNFYKED